MELSEKNKVSQQEYNQNYPCNVSTPLGGGAAGSMGSPRKKCRSGGGGGGGGGDNLLMLSEDQAATLPLLHLVRQLLRNASTQTHMRLQVIL